MTATLEAPAPAAASPAGRTSRGWWATAAVGLVAGLVRFLRLDLPEGFVFDEVYYACDARGLLQAGVELVDVEGTQCELTDEGSYVVHPPLGKWAIALGIRVFGFTELGWRAAAALAGTLTVIVLVRAARRLTGSTLLGCVAGLLLAVESLHVVQSRIAMLDVFLVLWTTAAFACLLVDRDVVRERLPLGLPLGLRAWRLAAGLCLGAAVATKWSGAYYLAVLALLALVWEVGARRTAGDPSPVRSTLVVSTAPAAAALVVLPVAVYVASWTGWFRSDAGYFRDWTEGQGAGSAFTFVPDALRSLWHYHAEMLRFHSGLSSPHPYESSPLGWLLLERPVSYLYPTGLTAGQQGCEVDSCARAVLAVGNPLVFWGGTLALVALAWMWLRHRDGRAATVLALTATAVVPWLRDEASDRTMFAFYVLPAVPFLCLGIALVAGWAIGPPGARRRVAGVAGTALVVSAAIALFAFFYPVLAAVTIPIEAWQDRIWFDRWI